MEELTAFVIDLTTEDLHKTPQQIIEEQKKKEREQRDSYEKIPPEYLKESGIWENDIASLDPGFVNCAGVIAHIKIDAKKKVLTLTNPKVMQYSLGDAKELPKNIVQMTNKVDKMLFNVFGHNADTLFIMEKQYLNLRVNPKNPYAFVTSMNLQILQNAIYSALFYRHNFIQLIDSRDVKKFFGSGTGNHHSNKVNAVEVAANVARDFKNGEELVKILLPSQKYEENHIADCFLQLMFWCYELIESSIIPKFGKKFNLNEWKFIFEK